MSVSYYCRTSFFLRGQLPQKLLLQSPFYLRNRILSNTNIRCLGNQARGPRANEIGKHFDYAVNLFKQPDITYDGYKQQCESFRLFLFWGVTGLLSLDLFLRPPKSSYWKLWNPLYIPYYLWHGIIPHSSQCVFFNNQYQGTSEGWKEYEAVMSRDRNHKKVLKKRNKKKTSKKQ